MYRQKNHYGKNINVSFEKICSPEIIISNEVDITMNHDQYLHI